MAFETVSMPYINIKEDADTDIYLTGNPEITFSKIVYRRYTDYEMKYCIIDKCKLTENKKLYHYDINIKDKCHLLYKIYLIPNNDVSFSNIKNVKITCNDCTLVNMSGICIKNIYNHGNFINIFDTVVSGLALPVVTLSDSNISVNIEFYNDMDSEIVMGIKYGNMYDADELQKFKFVSHEYLERCYHEDIITVNKNEKKVITLNRNNTVEAIKFIMIPDTNINMDTDCSMNGYLKTTTDKYPINKFQCVDIIYDQICEQENKNNDINTSIERFFIPQKNMYLLNFKHTGLSNHSQPAGYLNLKNGNKIVFIPNFTGTIHVVYREFNILCVGSININYKYKYDDQNDDASGNVMEDEIDEGIINEDEDEDKDKEIIIDI